MRPVPGIEITTHVGVPVEGLACALTWKEPGATVPSPHVLDVRMRAWDHEGRDA